PGEVAMPQAAPRPGTAPACGPDTIDEWRSRRPGRSVKIHREPPSRQAHFPQGGIPMNRSSGHDRRARRPALEQCEDRILQSITVEPVGNKATPPRETSYTPDGSRIVVLYQATPDHASRVFDDPFFFDVN